MGSLIAAITAVNADDACYSLKELEEPAPDSRGFHRYRILLVVPGGRLQAGMLVVDAKYLCEWRFDMGLASECAADQLAIIGGWPREDGTVEILETAGDLIEMAERMHAGYIDPVERPEPSNLIGGYFDQADQKRKGRKRVSTFGFGQPLLRS